MKKEFRFPMLFLILRLALIGMHFCFNINQKSLGNLPIEKFFQALQSEDLNEIDRPGSTYPLNLLPLFQNPGELFPIYKKYYFSYKHTDFPKAERFYQNTIKLSVWVFKKYVKLVNLYIRGIKKVIKNYHILIYEAKINYPKSSFGCSNNKGK